MKEVSYEKKNQIKLNLFIANLLWNLYEIKDLLVYLDPQEIMK